MPTFIPVTATSLTTGETFTYRSMTEAAKKGGFDRSCIHSCIRGHSPSHAGFTFKALKPLRPISDNLLQHRIAALLNEGKTREEVAEALGIQRKTVRSKLATARRMGLLNEGL